MFIIGNKKQLESNTGGIKFGFGSKVLETVEEDVTILDENYGADRDYLNDDGGYVVLLTNANDVNNFDKSNNNIISRKMYEDFNDVDEKFIRVLYLVNNETGIVVVMPKEFFSE